VAWLAAARATKSGQGPRYSDAAFATALHDTLVSLVPAKASDLDAQLAASLSAIPDGRQKERGVAAGQAEAQRVLAEDQFDPGPPPALSSTRYLDALAEVHSLGGATSSARTAAQTDTARFWAQSSLLTYTQVLREVLAASGRPLAWQARLAAAFHAIQIDQQIAIHAAKYRYLFWRPVTAIQTGSVDQDPSWTPLVSTPRHPEYPSGHAGFGGTAEVVLGALASATPQEPITAASSTDGGAVHSWTSWTAITNETIDARVWEGVHFRFSDEVGAQLGRDVAAYDLKRLAGLGL
jgi:hypothetical protein